MESSCEKNNNQYYSDVVGDDGLPDKSKYFNGESIYPKLKSVSFNNFKNYKSKEYYSYINEGFKEYSFPEDYSTKTFADICESGEYSLKPQQKFAGRVFNTNVDNTGILIYHGLGSGKTQTSIVIGEAFKFRGVNGIPLNCRSEKHVLVVVPASLTEQYYSEIVGYIDNGKIKSASGEIIINGERQYYLNEKLRKSIEVLNKNITRLLKLMNSLDEKSREYSIYQGNIIDFRKQINFLKDEENKKVKSVYEILSHDRFLNKLYTSEESTFTEGEYLQRLKNPNALLIIDEAHRLVSSTGTSYRKLLFALRYHAHPQFKTVLLSGSPIYDKPFEFGLMLNLLRPRMVFPDGFDKFNEVFLSGKEMINIPLFKKMCSGYISYFKGGNPEAYPYKKTIVMHHSMGPYQYSVYKSALLKEIEKDKEAGTPTHEEFLVKFMTSESNDDAVSTSVFNNSRLFCNIAFPEVNITKEQSIKGKPVRKTVADAGLAKFRQLLLLERRNNQELSIEEQYSSVIKKTEEYSSKFASIARLVEVADGPVFIYSNYVTYGVEAMAAVMFALGYSEYLGIQTPGESRGNYFIWKGGEDPDKISQANRMFNSKENEDGSIIKIMFGTQSVMEGVDFKRVRQVHVMDPWWNDSRMQQVIARAIRLCSHQGLSPNKRVTDVFIHLSVLGGGEKLFKIKYLKTLTSGEVVEQNNFSLLNVANPRSPSNEWFYYIASVKIDKFNTIQSINELVSEENKFYANQIISIKKLKDPELTRLIGTWKNLDNESVEEYMYSRALSKLKLNRQFEMAIKEVALDCEINKNGNIIRLDEKYTPDPRKENTFLLEYENYSNGDRYVRLGVKSQFDKQLPDNFLTLRDILENTAKNSSSFKFKNTTTGELLVLNKSLILSENINCNDNPEYSFENIPKQIVDLTINKELIKYLMKIDINTLKKFLVDVEQGKIDVNDKKLVSKIKKFYSKESLTEKQQIIEKLKALGIADDDTPWEFEYPETLKKLLKSITKK